MTGNNVINVLMGGGLRGGGDKDKFLVDCFNGGGLSFFLHLADIVVAERF